MGYLVVEKLLAKSVPSETLEEHTGNCLHVWNSVRTAYPFLPEISGNKYFFSHLFYVLALHDIGKAAIGFQNQLHNNEPWRYRHEILSAAFVLEHLQLSETDKYAIALAIITHHKNVNELREQYSTTASVEKQHYFQKLHELEPNFSQMEAFIEYIGAMANDYDITMPEIVLNRNVREWPDPVNEVVNTYYWNIVDGQKSPLSKIYGTLLRGYTIASDHLASFGRDEIRPGLKEVEVAYTEFEWYPFQTRCLTTFGHAQLIAPTGSGKTEAAVLWAGRQQDAGRRIFYVLPFTASINAMYNRLKSHFGNEDVGILHGKAHYFIYRQLLDKKYTPDYAQKLAGKALNLSHKMYHPLKVLTPHQLLRAFFQPKGWESQIAEVIGGIFVFDEIHAYDPRTTALILGMVDQLVDWGGKFLFLSATFPDFLKTLIEETISDLHQIQLDVTHPQEQKFIQQPRHQIQLLPGELIEHSGEMLEDLENQKRVLVVCNTVKRAQEMYMILQKDFNGESILFHSRFILQDRERKEQRINHIQLLVATQTVEVSLDINFDVLYTEPAPIDALVQRFGRVNRAGNKGVVPVKIAVIPSEKDHYIYSQDFVEKTLNLFQDGKELNQQDVEQMVNTVYSQGYTGENSQIYENTRSEFAKVITGMTPHFDSDAIRDFYALIRTVEVVPIQFESEYLKAIEEGSYLGAMRYLTNISFGQKYRLTSLDRIGQRRTVKGDFYWSVDARYNTKFGLQLDQSEIGSAFFD